MFTARERNALINIQTYTMYVYISQIVQDIYDSNIYYYSFFEERYINILYIFYIKLNKMSKGSIKIK